MSNQDIPSNVREMIREGKWSEPTSGLCMGYVQANLVILPKEWAYEFLLFCVRNPKPCPILEVLDPGVVEPKIARDADIRRDLPKYRIYKNGGIKEVVEDISGLFTDDMMSFLLGCSFSFEKALMDAGIGIRNIDEGKNVSMYITDRKCQSAGRFSAPLVVSMRPMKIEEAIRASQITTRFYLTHGAPVYMDDPHGIGIDDINRPDFGDPVTIREGEIPVFWACGVTSQLAIESASPPIAITHHPGHMFITDLKNEDLTVL